MSNLKIFGSPIHDTAIIFIASSTVASIFLYANDSEISRGESNITLLVGAISAVLYWFKEYKPKK